MQHGAIPCVVVILSAVLLGIVSFFVGGNVSAGDEVETRGLRFLPVSCVIPLRCAKPQVVVYLYGFIYFACAIRRNRLLLTSVFSGMACPFCSLKTIGTVSLPILAL